MSDLVDRSDRQPEYQPDPGSEIVPVERWTCIGCCRTFSPDDPCFAPGVCVDCIR